MQQPVSFLLLKYQDQFGPVVPFNPEKDRLALLDLSGDNKNLTQEIFNWLPETHTAATFYQIIRNGRYSYVAHSDRVVSIALSLLGQSVQWLHCLDLCG